MSSAADRHADIDAFLDQAGWRDAGIAWRGGDFSPRRYARLTRRGAHSAMLMDADADQKTDTFVALARWLWARDIAAPEIFVADAARGLVLMQDFGDDNLGAAFDADGVRPDAMAEGVRPDAMAEGARILARLHRTAFDAAATGADLPLFDNRRFADQAELFLDDYLPSVRGRPATDDERASFRAALLAMLAPLDAAPRHLLLRDYMPDNLMRLAAGGLGVLDFQDAGIGPVAYDLASLCEEVRRDGGFACLDAVLDAYCAANPDAPPRDVLRDACFILSMQRHIRILGIVAGHARRTGRDDKLIYLPRIRRHLHGLRRVPSVAPMARWFEAHEDLLR